MAKVALVSACLAGMPVAYDGRERFSKRTVNELKNYDRVILVCPEKALFGVPRAPMEISGGDGADFMAGRGELVTNSGAVPSEEIRQYMERLVEIAVDAGVDTAFLKEKSPFCGAGRIYDGTFSGKVVPGKGIMAAVLAAKGVRLVGVD